METDGLESMTLDQLMSQYRDKTVRPTIRSLRDWLGVVKRRGYIEARKVVESLGGLPRNVVHEQVLVNSDDWMPLAGQGYYPAWAREMIVAPENGGVFRNGEDIVDTYTDDGRSWVFPSYCIPEGARQKRGKGLFVDPRKIIEGPKEVMVIADPSKDVVVLDDFLQESGWGKVDPATGVPLYARNVDASSRGAGYFCRPNQAFVQPFMRGIGYTDLSGYRFYYGRRSVDAGNGHYVQSGVGVESREAASQDLESVTLGQLLETMGKKKARVESKYVFGDTDIQPIETASKEKEGKVKPIYPDWE